MTNPQNDELDLKPWAAYVVGHHPYFLRLEQEKNWRRAVWHGEQVDIFAWRSLDVAIERIEEALRILVLGGEVNAAALVELHRAKDAFARICEEQQRSPPEFDPNGPTTVGTTECFYMRAFSEQILTSRGELDKWRQFGAEVGRAQFQLWDSSIPYCEQPRPRDIELATLAGQLTSEGKYAFLLRLASTEDNSGTEPQSPPIAKWKEIQLSHLKLAHLDLEVRAALRKEAAPEPLLVLDADTITFYGERKSLSQCRPAEVACLWVLAENAGQYVKRSVLTKAADVESELNLKTHISRLRKILKPLAKAGSRRTGRELLPSYTKGFIIGSRAGENKNGPYVLDIDIGLVEIKVPRPRWMPRS